MTTRHYVTALFVVVLLIPISLMAWHWFDRTPSRQPVELTDVTSGDSLPAVTEAGSYRLKTTLKLTDGDSDTIIEGEYEVDYVPPNRIRVNVIKSTNLKSELSNKAPLYRFVFDGERYYLEKDGVLMTAGRLNSETMNRLTRFPGGKSYLVNQLVGLSPFEGRIRYRSVSEGTVVETDTRTVLLAERGHVASARSPTRWHQRQHGPYFDVDYSETVTAVDRGKALSKQDITVPDRVMRTARGETGTTIPNHSFRMIDGETFRLHQLEGPKLINVWATWCPPCLFEIPHLNRVSDTFGDRLHVIGITSEDREPVASFLEENEVNYRVARLTGAHPAPYQNFNSLPFTFLVDRNNRIKFVVQGPRDEQQWKELINKHLLQ